MKPSSRVLGIDDGPFRFGDTHVPLVGVAVQAPSYIDGILMTRAEVDGTDATDRVAEMVGRSRYREGLAMILIDGAAVGGFNVIDVEGLCRRLGIPVVTVTRRKPDLAAIQRALRRRFEDWEGRWRVLTKLPLETIAKGSGRLHVAYAGATREEVRQALAITTIRGTIPEPLRIAHLIAAAIVRGESRGRA